MGHYQVQLQAYIWVDCPKQISGFLPKADNRVTAQADVGVSSQSMYLVICPMQILAQTITTNYLRQAGT